MRRALAVLLAIAVSAFSAQAQARLPYENCFTQAATRFGVDKQILVAIAQTESSLNPAVIGPRNRNGTYDIGIMQINSAWLPTLNKLGIQERDLQGACTNIHVGAWILAKNIGRHGATWKAVGAYNASTPAKQVVYVNKVLRNYQLVGRLVNG